MAVLMNVELRLMNKGLNKVSKDRNGGIKDKMQWGPGHIYKNS
jgi:hypothetical protein